jgi:hypothetical protein
MDAKLNAFIEKREHENIPFEDDIGDALIAEIRRLTADNAELCIQLATEISECEKEKKRTEDAQMELGIQDYKLGHLKANCDRLSRELDFALKHKWTLEVACTRADLDSAFEEYETAADEIRKDTEEEANNNRYR